MADTRRLLSGLIEYQSALDRHVQSLRQEFDELDLRWQSFSMVYDGDAADQFKYGWDRTTDRFRYYLERTQAIARVLESVCEAIKRA